VLFLALGAWLPVSGGSAQPINQGAVMQDTASLGDAEFVRRAVIAHRFEIEEQSGRSEQLRAPAIKMLPAGRKPREAVSALNAQ
jgi:hypothetical protein